MPLFGLIVIFLNCYWSFERLQISEMALLAIITEMTAVTL
ncbi:hypothetical protein HMPREF9999_01200 [Alloprevotella sp. oral taxon 473 str. F0040]|nr:hypothetical protein HMPREF9999_01200 [Alloprevotella sp. oral taxon 473 str. F0040]